VVCFKDPDGAILELSFSNMTDHFCRLFKPWIDRILANVAAKVQMKRQRASDMVLQVYPQAMPNRNCHLECAWVCGKPDLKMMPACRTMYGR
jgi:hypothetical protein